MTGKSKGKTNQLIELEWKKERRILSEKIIEYNPNRCDFMFATPVLLCTIIFLRLPILNSRLHHSFDLVCNSSVSVLFFPSCSFNC